MSILFSRILITFSILLVVAGTAISQENDASFIDGTITNQEGEPLPYASVEVYDLDSTLIAGLSADETGYFKTELPHGDYTIHIKYLSYRNQVIRVDDMNQSGRTPLGNIQLGSGGTLLDEIEITAQRSQMELKLDKRVVNVGADLANAGTNVSDLLDNIPSVAVDVEGNVSLRGSQNVRILVDGKPSGLLGNNVADALRQLQSDMVERVEIITNPSARYDAEGEVGIINIVMKKENRSGFHGSVDLTVGNPHNYGAGINFNLRHDWINLFLNGGLYYRKSPGGGSTYQRFEGSEGIQIYKSETDRYRSGLSNRYQFGADFFLSEYSTITASGIYRFSDGKNRTEINYRDLDAQENVLARSQRVNVENEDGNDLETAINYTRTFDEKDRKFTADFKWLRNLDNEIADIRERFLTNMEDDLLQNSNNIEGEENFLFQADYIDPVGEEGRFEAGLKANLRDVSNDFQVTQQNENHEWIILPEFDDNLTYFENIYAAYAIYGNKFNKISYQFGLRLEHSDITTRLENERRDNNRRYTDFFPTAHFTYEVNPENQFQLSYSRRLSRPWFRMLLPFSNFSDNRSRRVGNPDLDPEYSHSLETGYLHYFDKGSLLSSVYYRHRTGVIERISQFTDEGIELEVPVNLSTQNAYGIEWNMNYDFFKWLQYTINLNFYQAITEGSYLDRTYHSNSKTMSGKTTAKFKFPKLFDFQFSFDYRAPRTTTQGRRNAIYSMDTGISRDILRGNGTISLTGRDLFNTRKYSGYAEGPEFYTEETFVWRSRQLTLNFNYRINQQKSNDQKQSDDAGGTDDFGI
ncbi:TonB-dependent receptor [Membranicola marinus]|uniref:TonB-dependent receptor n=1 Tax=Membranihabitans marinus TaxID=1227546 RepID=A0A953HXS6_9BACT|nr:TonB-dependent receptor [Membranihabitans marinus]MBY5957677.1 TonB-dependent receptor [Membranihabitans marinus]